MQFDHRFRRVGPSLWLLALFVVQPADAQRQSAVRGTIQGLAPQGIIISPSDASSDGPLRIAANSATKVMINFLAKTTDIQPGTYVQMRVTWDGKNLLKASSIKLPDGRPTMFGLYTG